jgi:hypothetical protein
MEWNGMKMDGMEWYLVASAAKDDDDDDDDDDSNGTGNGDKDTLVFDRGDGLKAACSSRRRKEEH